MFSCDYQDLVNPQKKTMEEANKFIGSVMLDGVEVDTKRSFTEMYSSSPRAADSGLDHLPLEGLPRQSAHRQADRLRLAQRPKAPAVRPGADVQLPGDPAVSRIIGTKRLQTASWRVVHALQLGRPSMRAYPLPEFA